VHIAKRHRITHRLSTSDTILSVMNWKKRVRKKSSLFMLAAAAGILTTAALWTPTQVRIRNIMSTWLTGSALAAGPQDAPSPDDAKLKAALQKRLLVPDAADLSLGPPLPAPLPGVTQRTVTINSSGQKFEVELFTGPSGDKGILAQRFGSFSVNDPWERVDMKLLHLHDRPTLGPADAPETIVEFADFECPYCAKAFGEIETLVNTTYKGKVHLIWKAFPLPGHAWAEQAAIAAECARQQNPTAFWTFAGDFYRDQTDITPQNLRQHIDDYANSLNLDTKALSACVLGSTAEARVDQDRKDGEAVHVMSTPTFLVNGVPVIGLPSSNVFDFVITSQLEARRSSR
jgi:protein-disulfide isomerase